MCSHWGKHAPQLYNILRNYIAIFDEYPMENTHSILHSQTKDSDSADELRKRAKSIFQSKGKQSDRSFFTTPRQFSFSHDQLHLLKVRCAQALSSMFIKISQSPRQSQFSSNNSCNTSVPTHVILPTMSPNKNMKMTVLSLGYRCDIKLDQTKKCDLPLCNISSHENWTLLHGCFHSTRFYLISSFYQEPFKQTRQKYFEETKINGLPPPERYHSCPKDISTQSQEKRLRAPEN